MRLLFTRILLKAKHKVLHLCMSRQIQQQVSKEYDQLKSIQKELTELTMGMANTPLQALRRNMASTETETRDPAAWFRADPDIWSPPQHRDPDVFGPPIDRSLPQMPQMPQGRPQRPGTNRKVDNRRGPPSKTSAKDAKGGPRKSTAPATSARSISKDSNRRTTDSSQNNKENKEDENKDEEPPAEDERKFEASNHIDGDLVDVLGMDKDGISN